MFVPAVRVRTPELMDQPGLDRREHDSALTALGRANIASRTMSVAWPAIQRVARTVSGRPLRVLDIACGGGHVAVNLARRFARAGIAADVLGCDVSPVALEYARTLAARACVQQVRFDQLDAIRDAWPTGFDVVHCSLFLHHLADEEAVETLRRMKDAARHLVVVSDLRRTDLGYLFAWIGCRLLSRSRVFHVDGPLSVAAAFSTAEARALTSQAGLDGAELRECWPQRFLLTWRQTSDGVASFKDLASGS
ncbi:MAG: methyltransferase domain-containing protein [Acidobacteria bacterium]|nr:methyltransferase domain-containing protein [Acidobacteriota bacterium]